MNDWSEQREILTGVRINLGTWLKCDKYIAL